jgi:hypothetical protein
MHDRRVLLELRWPPIVRCCKQRQGNGGDWKVACTWKVPTTVVDASPKRPLVRVTITGKQATTQEPVMAAVETARVTLKRFAWPPGDLFRSYKVLIDGAVVGWIRRRQTKTFAVPPGHHEVHLEIDWCQSQEIALDLAPGEEAKLTCRAQWPSTYAITRGRNSYIALDVVGREPQSTRAVSRG